MTDRDSGLGASLVETFKLLIDAVPQTSCDMQEWNIKVKNEKDIH